MSKQHPPEPLDFFIWTVEDVGKWLEEINLGSYRQIFKENGVNGEYLEGMSMFTTEQILRFIRRCHMKWGDFITLCKELRRIKDLYLRKECVSCSTLDSMDAFSVYFLLNNKSRPFLEAVIDVLKMYSTVACLKGEQKVRRPWWAPFLSIFFVKVAKRNRQSRVVSLKLEP